MESRFLILIFAVMQIASHNRLRMLRVRSKFMTPILFMLINARNVKKIVL